MRIGILLPHVFAQQSLLSKVIFAPVDLAVKLANELCKRNSVVLFTPGKIKTQAGNISVDQSLLKKELEKQNCTLPELIHKSPLAFVSLSRQIQAELTAKAFEFSNSGKLDILHVFMCESEIPLYFSSLVDIPVVFTHHDPYNFYRKYRASFPRLENLNYVSISLAQRRTAPAAPTAPGGMNFIANVYNGIDISQYKFIPRPKDHFSSMGRIIRNKGVHTAIAACLNTGSTLKFAGKYYTDSAEPDEGYWRKHIRPKIDNEGIIYEGFINKVDKKAEFLGNSRALLFPIEWEEPFGMVIIEALACGTPVIAFDRGSVREIIQDGRTGFIVKNQPEMEDAIGKIDSIERQDCRKSVEERFTIRHMAEGYLDAYTKTLKS